MQMSFVIIPSLMSHHVPWTLSFNWEVTGGMTHLITVNYCTHALMYMNKICMHTCADALKVGGDNSSLCNLTDGGWCEWIKQRQLQGLGCLYRKKNYTAFDFHKNLCISTLVLIFKKNVCHTYMCPVWVSNTDFTMRSIRETRFSCFFTEQRLKHVLK